MLCRAAQVVTRPSRSVFKESGMLSEARSLLTTRRRRKLSFAADRIVGEARTLTDWLMRYSKLDLCSIEILRSMSELNSLLTR